MKSGRSLTTVVMEMHGVLIFQCFGVHIVPDSVPDKDQVETFTPAMYSTHYCASPPLQRSKLHHCMGRDIVATQGEPVNYV